MKRKKQPELEGVLIEQALEKFADSGGTRDEEAIKCLLRDPPIYEPADMKSYQERYMRIKKRFEDDNNRRTS